MKGASRLADDLVVKMQGLQNKLDQIKHLSHTPILENLKVFQLSTDTDKSVIDLLNYIINKEKTE
jgi:succinate dehydrogenase/fumarate reductase-like Fe-S protein